MVLLLYWLFCFWKLLHASISDNGFLKCPNALRQEELTAAIAADPKDVSWQLKT